MRWEVEVVVSWQKNALNFGEDLFFFGDHSIVDRKTLWIVVKTFFFLEIAWFWTEKRSEFWWRPFFFGDHLILDRKTVWICLNPIENKWKFGSSSFTVESNFKKSLPPFAKSWLRDWIRLILSYLKVAYFQNKLAFSTRYTNKITVIYQCAFPGSTVLHFVTTHILFSKFVHRL